MNRIARLQTRLQTQRAAFVACQDEPDAATALRREDSIRRQMAETRRLIARGQLAVQTVAASRAARVSA